MIRENLRGHLEVANMFSALRKFRSLLSKARCDELTVDEAIARFNCDSIGFEAFHNTCLNCIDVYDKRLSYKVIETIHL